MHYSPRFLTGIAVFLALVALYTITSVSARDPTSIYFSPRKGYVPQYSTVRREQAETFVSAYDHAQQSKIIKASTNEKKRKLCVGIPSIKRSGTGYLRDTVGSLLQGLTPEERQEIYLIVFIPESKPEVHEAYNEKWLQGFADQVLTYDFGFERFTPYIAMIEDDTVAMDGWYHRTMAAIHEAEEQAALRRSKPDFLYLRLFYTEEFLGWNHEHWKSYLWRSLCVAALPTALLVFVRVFQPRTKLSVTLTTRRAFLTLYAILAALILFYFSLGRLTVSPIPSGVHEMPRFGCCSQAYVFPNLKAQDLVAYFKERHVGYTDVLLEDFANERKELRFAITPSVVQHVGRKNEEADEVLLDRGGRNVAEKVWSFAFERFDEVALRREHEGVAEARRKVDMPAASDS
jgi:hypothetical protein